MYKEFKPDLWWLSIIISIHSINSISANFIIVPWILHFNAFALFYNVRLVDLIIIYFLLFTHLFLPSCEFFRGLEDWGGGGLACLATQSLGSAPATLHMNNFGETFDIGNTVTTCTLKRLPFVLTGRLDRSVHRWNSSILPNWESFLWVNWSSFKNRVSLARNSSHLHITFANWPIKQAVCADFQEDVQGHPISLL